MESPNNKVAETSGFFVILQLILKHGVDKSILMHNTARLKPVIVLRNSLKVV